MDQALTRQDLEKIKDYLDRIDKDETQHHLTLPDYKYSKEGIDLALFRKLLDYGIAVVKPEDQEVSYSYIQERGLDDTMMLAYIHACYGIFRRLLSLYSRYGF